jgi:hypothetical protein
MLLAKAPTKTHSSAASANANAAPASIGSSCRPRSHSRSSSAGGSFRSRRHRDLLATAPVLPWPKLAALQSAYVATEHELERRAIGVELERAVRELNEDGDEQAARDAALAEFDALFDEPPTELDLEQLARDLDRWHDALIVRDLRRARVTWRTIAERLDTTVGRARRLLSWFDREPRAVP